MAVENSFNSIQRNIGKHVHFLYHMAPGAPREKVVIRTGKENIYADARR
jgi:hypothetical protein